ncbi:hypothetical protein M427DRAFT_54806 [Gonapodya prolifera JEL478]|uniref:ZZ-type domain-containing protein n=1 Tax=Gonapodya prolifera (strain JEL478) TaxID=1344416 RepID=A0A139AK50_GONPJ|nr:hypothetical protein M427DRAFT_54806 [Gonapodya prolifera JEL478]|eukprot:KXS17150.1 hypothetical protein M427DRAFT_54806 [Gonapodya prolifera JEL478]
MSRDFKNVQPPPLSTPVGQTQSLTAAPLWPTVYCDGCRLHGLSERFKCMVCADFDLCIQCYGDAARIHAGHPFGLMMPLARDGGPRSMIGCQRAVWQGVQCGGCHSTGLHERYKCLNCADYDLCTNCVRDAPRIHPWHPFRLFLPPTTPTVPGSFQSPSQPRRPWPTVSCDGCGLQGVQERFKCRTCPDYDLCKNCHKIASVIHPGHQFGLRYPAAVDVNYLTPVWHDVVCNNCGGQNISERYKCNECPDYDLCHACFQSVAYIHPQHTFYLLHPEPRGQARPPVLDQKNFWASATCDYCDREGLDSRFKCLSCPDYDLCGSCYRFRGSVHGRHNFGLVYPPASLVQSRAPSQISRTESTFVVSPSTCSACRKTNLQEWLKCHTSGDHGHNLCEDCFQANDFGPSHGDFELVLLRTETDQGSHLERGSETRESIHQGTTRHVNSSTSSALTRDQQLQKTLDELITTVKDLTGLSFEHVADAAEKLLDGGSSLTLQSLTQAALRMERDQAAARGERNGSTQSAPVSGGPEQEQTANGSSECVICLTTARSMAFVAW